MNATNDSSSARCSARGSLECAVVEDDKVADAPARNGSVLVVSSGISLSDGVVTSEKKCIYCERIITVV